jgi:hypothetical protein
MTGMIESAGQGGKYALRYPIRASVLLWCPGMGQSWLEADLNYRTSTDPKAVSGLAYRVLEYTCDWFTNHDPAQNNRRR